MATDANTAITASHADIFGLSRRGMKNDYCAPRRIFTGPIRPGRWGLKARDSYQIPVRPIYKLYPVCHPDREPKGVLVQREMESGRTPLVF